MVQPKFNIIAAVCEGNGIGYNGTLPWRLKNEMAYFSKMTTGVELSEGKKNVVIMGRKTWDSIPPKFKPLPNRLNMVISSTMEDNNKDFMVFRSLESALDTLDTPPYKAISEDIWLIGGSGLYSSAIQLPNCHRLFITTILKKYTCDTFFPEIPKKFNLVKIKGVPEEKQNENGVEYVYNVYENIVD